MEDRETEERYRQVLVEDPEDAEARRGLAQLLGARGWALHERGEIEAAIECYEEALALEPSLAPAHNNLGNAYRARGRVPEAIDAYRSAIAADGTLAEAHLNLGIALHQARQHGEAERCYRAALELKPALAEASLNLGYLLEQEGDWRGAAARYRDAIAANPDDAEAHFNLALNLLAGGDFASGWCEYEWRLRMPGLAPHWPFQDRPGWDGAPLHGKTILLYAEQGFGDALQFVRYAPLVAQRGGAVQLLCQPKLKDLFSRIPGLAAVVGAGEPLPAFDVRCSLLSLPRIFGTTLDSIPAACPYLEADPARARSWRARLAGEPAAARVGLFWATDSRTSISSLKSMTLDALAPLAQVPGVVFYSLQRGETAKQAERAPRGMKIVAPGSALADFSDDAALVANLDLVISIDSATAHLAGALGKPAWTLVHYPPEWRWLREREDSPWYPEMRLYRRQRGTGWDGVVERVAADLAELVRGRPRRA